ncbi:MAG: hypothetical protein HQ549_06275 [Candidatus Omnitrophica bacterium]|nr:hypothetical protein [Candidatus Omnitrophota bacterium]
MRTLRKEGRKVFAGLLVMVFMLFIVAEAAYSGGGQGKERAQKRSNVMSPGYMNAALQKAANLEATDSESSNKRSNARWSDNPKDRRGQGNMGKPNMIVPYGFDKYSGREKSERSRMGDKYHYQSFGYALYAVIGGIYSASMDPRKITGFYAIASGWLYSNP